MSSDFRDKALHLFALSALALAQPFYDVIDDNVTFLTAHSVGPADVALLTFVIMAGLPLLFIFAIFLSGRLSKFFHEVIYTALFVSLSGLTALPIIKDIPSYSGNTKIILATFIGMVAYIMYRRYQPLRLFLSYLAPLVFLFPVNFLFYTDVTKLIFPKTQGTHHPISHIDEERKVPIVLIVLDEFPLTSLLNEYGEIDSVRYPHFKELSKNSFWFRNAITISEWTDLALPAILTGQYPSGTRTKIPTDEDYPNNLFTLLKPHYDFKVFEEITKLCPREKCKNPDFFGFSTNTFGIYLDAMILFGHTVLPEDYSNRLPSIQNRWKNFKRWNKDKWEKVYDDRLERVGNFLESINPENQSTLHFLHLTLPHSPTIYLPSGKAYDGMGNMIIGRQQKKDMWTLDSWMVTQAYQRHLLQVGYTDKIIGRIIEKMKTSGIYDDALLVITADHGISFLPGERARGSTQFNYSDILSVPLFIKLPHQKKGALKKEIVQVVDILPTMANILGINVPWSTDGKNVLKVNQESQRTRKLPVQARLKNNRYLEILNFPRNSEMTYKTLKKKYLLFGSGPQGLLYKIGPRKDLLGIKVKDALENHWIAKVDTKLDQARDVVQINNKANLIPSWITGRVKGVEINFNVYPKNISPFIAMSGVAGSHIQFNSLPTRLAIAINGTIQATTQTNQFLNPDRFAALVPEKAFREGTNEISIFKILEDKKPEPNINKIGNPIPPYSSDKKPYIWSKNKIQYKLAQGPAQSNLITDLKGNQFNVPTEKVGHIEAVKYSLEAMYLFGIIKNWQGQKGKIPFLIFNNNQLVFSDRLIILEHIGISRMKGTGNSIKPVFRVPVYQNKKVDLNNIRIFLLDPNTGIHEMEISQSALSYPNQLIPKHRFYGALSYCQDEKPQTQNKMIPAKPSGKSITSECF